jgi:hypothetical protein
MSRPENRQKKIEASRRHNLKRWNSMTPAQRRAETRKRGALHKACPEERYRELMTKQKSRCAICRNIPFKKRHSIDHDHTKDLPDGTIRPESIRGLLCQNCNMGLGKFKDSILLLRAAITYLEEHP